MDIQELPGLSVPEVSVLSELAPEGRPRSREACFAGKWVLSELAPEGRASRVTGHEV